MKAPSAVKRWSADMAALADTGCQAGYAASSVTDSEELDLVPCSPNEDETCLCPRREPVPEAFPEYDSKLSVQQLKKRIIQHFAGSAFNRCTRQTLPLMKGEPLPIPVRSDVRPTAIPTPVAMPLHREAKVNRDLMRDVALGVIDPVPVNTPDLVW